MIQTKCSIFQLRSDLKLQINVMLIVFFVLVNMIIVKKALWILTYLLMD